jgi:methionine biosynthesis protein MetW
VPAAAQVRNKPFVGELLGRGDFAIIGDIVEPNSKVLDLGCGEGELLEWLAENKNVEARGVEISPVKVRRAIARGVSAHQGDIDEVLEDYSDHAFDYVILSQTLQETRSPLKVMREMLRRCVYRCFSRAVLPRPASSLTTGTILRIFIS